MTFVLGALLGICWGALGALVNSRIIKIALAKNTVNAITAGNMARMLVDVLFFLIAFLLRDVIPVSFVANMVGVAAGLSIGNIIFSFILTKPEKASAAAAQAEKASESVDEAAIRYAELENADETAAPVVSIEPVPDETPDVPVETAREKEIRELKERLAQLEAEKDE